MDLRPGDRVELLDDDLSGIVQKIHGNDVQIITEDGFEMSFPADHLVKIKNDINDIDVEEFDLEQVIKEKTPARKKQSTRSKPKDKGAPPMEVDLHINQLVKSSKGMANHEMLNLQLDTARHKLEFAMKKRIQKVVFIHGVGEGVLKMELEYLLGRYSNIKFYDADYQKYGLGATEVYILQNA
ncbi:Smr/MutS family protein [Christiangramia sabulilitoris]|uniref:DNA mismatch repair protein MutS n=1 Tax=Christiangramia sabulilitoris TaxID=2583991 RepID=A0A550HX11_9FLAO|nr:Smr/MutS family protein [Christiangramia sabulilitoris]TRO63304.1 DNA mismatch repair protein MutS [Christiangramia sabulilitoris]